MELNQGIGSCDFILNDPCGARHRRGLQQVPLEPPAGKGSPSDVRGDALPHRAMQRPTVPLLTAFLCFRSGLEQDDMRILYKYLTTSLFPRHIEPEVRLGANLSL